jgi:hypothetical protein
MDIRFSRDVSEKTNRGKLSKAWYTVDGVDYLVKGNTPGSVGSLGKVGYEPYSEVLASDIADFLSIPHVKYELADAKLFPDVSVSRIKHVSTCRDYLPTGCNTYPLRRYLIANGVKSRADAFSYLLTKSGLDLRPLYMMLLFDALIGNEDRHMNNIDLVMAPNGSIIFSPIFDNGASLLAWRYSFQLPTASIPYLLDSARPFETTHKKQLALIPRGIIPKVRKDFLLEGILHRVEKMRGLMSNQRVNAIKGYLTWRIRYLEEVMR